MFNIVDTKNTDVERIQQSFNGDGQSVALDMFDSSVEIPYTLPGKLICKIETKIENVSSELLCLVRDMKDGILKVCKANEIKDQKLIGVVERVEPNLL
ncbi:MAG: hypothetical protein ACR2MD_07655 [Aridibacter sp.]